MLMRQILFGALAILTTASVATAGQVYRAVDLSTSRFPQSMGTSAIIGQQAGAFIVGSYTISCGQSAATCTASRTHGALWTPASGRPPIDLNPSSFSATPGYFSSMVLGLSKEAQVGFGYATKPFYKEQSHALLWHGTARSMVDLHPARFNGSVAYAIDGYRIAGAGFLSGVGTHALLWLGMPTAVIDLNPRGASSSEALAVSNGVEGGYVFIKGVGKHAYIWHGTATNGRDLNPSGVGESYINGINGTVATGAVKSEYGLHAYMWSGLLTATGIDLHTPRFTETEAVGGGYGKQVGWGEMPLSAAKAFATYHALVWSGSAGSCVDLHAFLPAGFTSSRAVAIAPDGSIVGYALDKDNKTHAIVWMPSHI